MIRSLHIKNLATIEEIELPLQDGFTILTGETGSGKSIIIDGIRLVLGEKSSPDMIRTGKKETSVEVIFPFHQAIANFKDYFPEKEEEMFLQRKVPAKGTGKAYINGIHVPNRKLKELGVKIVDIYGQNDHVFLLNLEYQLNYLDDFAGASALKKDVSRLARELKKIFKEKTELEEKEKEREQRLDFLEFQIKEIEGAQLKPGEEEDLRNTRNILKNAEKIGSLVESALSISYSQENSISSLLAQLQNTVHNLVDFDKTFKETEDAINQFSITIQEFSDFLFKFQQKQDAAPERLEELEERLSQIEKLKRKYGRNIEEILSHLGRVKQEYEELSTSQEKLEDLDKEIQKIFNEYKSHAEKLSDLRKKNADKLEKDVEKEISLLGMKKARFKIKIDTIPLKPESIESVKESGTEEVEFLISPNPGEDLRPLRKVASGGELSRVMLALKTIGEETDTFKTMIFDEIDSGIGGKTAEFVAQKLRQLSRTHQVICITHLPQIASFATHHYKIDKKIDKERTFTSVKKLSFEERVTEIARLLSGTRITETTLKNAREMISHNLDKSAC
ncbi:MAG: DNA repair protein RecN [Candidatus Aminicenantes bacterium]|nr:MAG: DNA repair protein RecN [Candidatus Aminicenantes bacterium]